MRENDFAPCAPETGLAHFTRVEFDRDASRLQQSERQPSFAHGAHVLHAHETNPKGLGDQIVEIGDVL